MEEGFLRSRDVRQEDILNVKQDKVDKEVLSVMTEDQTSRYITSYGDQLAVLFFCKQAQGCANKETEKLNQT